MKFVSLGRVLAVVATFSLGSSTFGQTPDRRGVSIEEKLAAELEHLGSQGYQLGGPKATRTLDRSKKERISMQLQGGTANAIVAVCDANCGRVSLSLFDYEYKLVTDAPENQGVVILNGTPPYSGYHEVEVGVPGCNVPTCSVIVALLHQPPPSETAPQSSSPSAQAPQEPLPAEVPVDSSILQLIGSHPFFANTPPVFVGSHRTVLKSTFIANGVPTTSTSEERTTIRWLRSGVIASESSHGGTVHRSCAPGVCTSKSRGISVEAGNGLVTLGAKSVSSSNTGGYRQGPSTWTSKLVRLDNIAGTVFPLQVGNEFSYRETIQITSDKRPDEITSSFNCKIVKEYEASRFHSQLVGAAYLKICDIDSIYKREKASSGKSKSRTLFFDSLGVWIMADSVSPREQVVQDDTPVAGFTNSRWFTTLENFSMAR